MAVSTLRKDMVFATFRSSAVSITAGTIGSYATRTTISVAKSGYKAVVANMDEVGHPAAYHPLLSLNSDVVSIAFYRTNTTAYAVPANDITVTVGYIKN